MKTLRYLLIMFLFLSCQGDPTDPPATTVDPYLEFTVNNVTIAGKAFTPYFQALIETEADNTIKNMFFEAIDSVTMSRKFKTYLISTTLKSNNIILNNVYNIPVVQDYAEILTYNSLNPLLVSGAYFLQTVNQQFPNPGGYINLTFTNKKYVAASAKYVWSGEINGKFINSRTPYDIINFKIKFKDIGYTN